MVLRVDIFKESIVVSTMTESTNTNEIVEYKNTATVKYRFCERKESYGIIEDNLHKESVVMILPIAYTIVINHE